MRRVISVWTVYALACTGAIVQKAAGRDSNVDTFRIDAPVSGARSESFWVIDSTSVTQETANSLKRSFSYYLKDLRSSGVQQSIIVLSGNAASWPATAVRRDGESMTIDSANPKADVLFADRVGLATDAGDNTNGWPSSPMWSTQLFLNRIPDLDPSLESMSPAFWRQGVPVEVMLISDAPDAYPIYQRYYPDWAEATPSRYHETFVRTAADSGKGWRLSAIAPGTEIGKPA